MLWWAHPYWDWPQTWSPFSLISSPQLRVSQSRHLRSNRSFLWRICPLNWRAYDSVWFASQSKCRFINKSNNNKHISTCESSESIFVDKTVARWQLCKHALQKPELLKSHLWKGGISSMMSLNSMKRLTCSYTMTHRSPLQFTTVIPNTFASLFFNLRATDSVVYYRTSANNPLYFSNTGEEASEGKNGEASLCAWQRAYAVIFKWQQRNSHCLNWRSLAEAG